MHSFDLELTSQDIQALHGPDSLAAFLTNLGYDTRARIAQTAANLGIPDPVQRRIKRIELLADHDRFLQVYLFELKSVTVADIKAISRVFRDKAGNFLFVLTADYEYIEFVLLDRVGESKSPTAISTAPPSLVQRRFSVDRRKPTPVHLRVLRRFTWTESDPFGQFDKLRFAYDLAHWSEVYFNNRGLFSDYYLRERLPARDGKVVEFAEWREDPKPAYQRLRAIYDEAAVRFPAKKTSELVGLLYEPLLRELGFTPSAQTSGDSGFQLRLTDPDSGFLLGICLPYPWGRELDRKDEMHDTETPEITPTFAVVDLLANEKAPWVVLTNGKLWRLYSQRAHSRATNYYEIDLDEILGRQGFQQDIQDAFRYFWLLFRVQAFRPEEKDWHGKRRSLSMLDRLLLGSEEYAKELGESLKNRVFTEVFPVLAEGFIAGKRQRGATELDDDTLTTIFQGTLTLLYRLLFLLYAEARDLLPVHSREYSEGSLQRIKDEIKEAGGNISEANSSGADPVQERTSRINKAFSASDFGLWQRLKQLFNVVDEGSEELNVPRYNGGLFLSKRDRDDHSPEAESSRFLEHERIADRHLALALDLLARDEDRKTKALMFIDYKSLGVRQLGSIYEGLLEFRLKIAGEKLAIVKEKGREVYESFKELSDRQKKKVDAQNAYVSRGHAYLENDKRERRATGSYYTPDHIVKYIVENAVGPVLTQKFEALRPKLREAQRQRREFFKEREDFLKRGMRPKPVEQADLIGKELVEELFNVKVLDPAMGSGHFLVEAVDFITDKTLEFLYAFPWNPVLVHLERMRKTIQEQMDDQNIDIDGNRLKDVNLLKRHVLKRCIYGVDVNPMAVELAKVSLWLDCFTLGAPLSFLDHHLRWGNSLIGSSIAEVDAIRTEKNVQLPLTATSDWQGLAQAVQAMVDVGGMPDITAEQVANSKRHFDSALADVEVFKRVLDLHTSRWFIAELSGAPSKKKVDIFDEMLRSGELFEWAHGRAPSPVAHTTMGKAAREVVDKAALASELRCFFHWELEFPEVFYGRRSGTINAVERMPDGGFDAVIGNPPYVSVTNISADERPFYLSRYSTAEGRFDIYVLFIENSLQLLGSQKRLQFINPIKFCVYANGKRLRELITSKFTLESIIDISQCDDVFEEPSTYPCLSLILNRPVGPGERIRIEKAWIPSSRQFLADLLLAPKNLVPMDRIKKRPDTVISPRFTLAILDQLERLEDGSQTLGHFYEIEQCIRIGSESRRKLLVLSEEQFLELSGAQQALRFPMLDGENLRPYEIRWSGQYLTYDLAQLYNPKTPELLNRKKILIKRVAERLTCVYERGINGKPAYPLNTVYALAPRGEVEPSAFYMEALLNSPLFDWIYRVQFEAIAIRGGYVEYRENLKYLPIRQMSWTPLDTDLCSTVVASAANGGIDSGSRIEEFILNQPDEARDRVTCAAIASLAEAIHMNLGQVHELVVEFVELVVDVVQQRGGQHSSFSSELEMRLLDQGTGDFESVWDAVRRDKKLKPVPAGAREGIKAHFDTKMPALRRLISSRREMQESVARLVCALYRLTSAERETVSTGSGLLVE
jgi:hypothetical protein